MPKTPKCQEETPKGNWADDQKDREYYYDDAHGYEEYDPEVEEEAEEEVRNEK